MGNPSGFHNATNLSLNVTQHFEKKMTPGIKIINNVLKYTEFPSKEFGLAIYCKSFNIKLDDIEFIGISPRLALDDEIMFIIIVNKNDRIFPIPSMVLRTEGLEKLEKHFGLEPIAEDWQKFEYDDHYGKVDKVLYPKEKYWNDLFENNWQLKFRQLVCFFKPRSFFGKIA